MRALFSSCGGGFPDPHDGIQKLVDDHIPYRNLEDAKLPLHIVTTDIVRATASCCRKAAR